MPRRLHEEIRALNEDSMTSKKQLSKRLFHSVVDLSMLMSQTIGAVNAFILWGILTVPC